MPIVYLSLGSNLGDKVGNIQQASSLLTNDGNLKLIRASAFYDTEPWGEKKQGWFLNAVLEISTKLSPIDLLKHCLNIEKIMGRVRDKNKKWAERIIDIDILFYENDIINKMDLIVPHPLLHKRAFVLVPLLELIADYKHPIFNKTIEELYELLEDPEDVFLYGTRLEDNE